MKIYFFFLVSFIALVTMNGAYYNGSLQKSQYNNKLSTPYKNGDIIFQSSNSGQSKAVQLATKSPFTHCGMLFYSNDEWQVLEAVQPVCITPLQDWVKRGHKSEYWVKRLKD